MFCVVLRLFFGAFTLYNYTHVQRRDKIFCQQFVRTIYILIMISRFCSMSIYSNDPLNVSSRENVSRAKNMNGTRDI